MLTTTATGDLLQDSAALRSLWSAESAPRLVCQQVEAMASGDQIAYTPRPSGESADHVRGRPRFAARLFGRALDLLTYLYARPPVRSGDERWGDVLWRYGAGLDVVMEQIDRVSRSTGTALVVAVPDTTDEAARLAGTWTPEGVSLYVLPRSRWCALSHPSDARLVHSILVQWSVSGDTVDWRLLTPQGVYRAAGSAAFERSDEVATWTTCPNTIDTLTWQGTRLGGVDLTANLAAVNMLAEQLPHTAILSRGQPVIANKDATNKVLAPDAFIEVSSAEDFKIVSGGADLAGMQGVLQMMLDSLATDWGLPKRAFSVRSVQEPYSAAVIQASQYELQQDRLRRERVAREWERRIHAAASRVWQAATGTQIDPTVQVLYTQMPTPTTAGEALAEARFLIEQRLAPRETVLRTLRPWLTDDEIAEALTAADTEADEQAQRVALVAGRLEATNGSRGSDPDRAGSAGDDPGASGPGDGA